MRTTSLVVLLALAAVAPASGQSGAGRYAYGLNPYDPFDAEILRNYGSVLVAQTPLSELRKLDPYDPTHAALLRSLGGGIPGWPWLLSGATADSWSPFAWSARAAAPPPNVLVVVVGQPPATTAAAASAAPATPAAAPPPGAVGSLRRPESNDGVWIPYAGQRWVAAGAAVPLDPAAFVRIGEYGGFPVFRRRGEGEDVIYVPSRQDLVAPYRVKR
jgi:hypothetical protein